MSERKTKRVPVIELKPGWILGKDVCSDQGAVLLVEGTLLTDYGISKLKTWDIESVDIIVKEDSEEPISKYVHHHSQEDVVFFDMYIESVHTIGTLFEEMQTSKKVPVKEFQGIAEDILEQVLGVQGVLSRLRQVKSGDEYTFNHSMNVGIYAVLIGQWLDYDEKSLRQLAMAGVLHDVGKAKIPAHILKKPGRLTPEEFAIMKQHPVYGYKLINNTVGISREIAQSVLEHHEREDGSGYPLNLQSDHIHPFAKVLAVADVYDAITSDRVYQAKKTPYMAADIIMEESFKTLDPVVVQKFLQQITSYFFTDQVRLSNGVSGTIVNVNPLRPTRPLIHMDDGSFIDLEKTPSLHIVELISR